MQPRLLNNLAEIRIHFTNLRTIPKVAMKFDLIFGRGTEIRTQNAGFGDQNFRLLNYAPKLAGLRRIELLLSESKADVLTVIR